ncbi:MAG: low molecular weight phosphatase family protein [Acidobacteriota bacterium]|nr:low molecular weight phosphatase family protein [Acidobacteriota bacterium]
MNYSVSPMVLFLCTGNYYRSRFSEIYFNHLSRKHNYVWQADSRGFRLNNEENFGAMSPFALSRLKNLKIDVAQPQRYPKALTAEDLERAGLIVALYDVEHRPWVIQNFPNWLEKIEYWQVPDVPLATPQAALRLIEKQIDKLFERLVLDKS